MEDSNRWGEKMSTRCLVVMASIVLCGCAKVHDRAYIPFEKHQEQCMIKIGLDMTEGGLLEDGDVLARAFLNIYSTVRFSRGRINSLSIGSDHVDVLSLPARHEIDAKHQSSVGLPWSYVARYSFNAQQVPFASYDVRADVDVLDESGSILESFEVSGQVKAQTVSRSKWLPY